MKDTDQRLTAIRHAIQNEIAGQSFYSDAALHCIDPWAKEVFAILADEENRHTQLLLAEYESLKAKDRWLDVETAIARGAEMDITRFTFAKDEPAEDLFPTQVSAAEVIDRRADDLDALAFGIQLEEKAIALYSESGRAVQDPAAKAAYDFLVKEETRHYHQLKNQWEKLAGRAWTG